MAAPALVRTWDIDTTGQPAPAQYSAYHGESVEFVARLLGANRRPVALDEGWTAALMVSTNGVDYWRWDGASVSTGGVIRATWEPRMDCGADTYRCFIRAADPSDSNLIYRAAFTLRLLGSPGAVPNELPLPAPSIDFATVEVANAPWLEEESDPVWAAERAGYATTGDLARAISAIPETDTTPLLLSSAAYPDWESRSFDGWGEGDTCSWRGRLWRVAGEPNWLGQFGVTPDHSEYWREITVGEILAALDSIGPAATNYTDAAVAAQSAENALLYQLVVGSNVVFEVTNYNSRAHAPSLRVLQLSETNAYEAIWTEARGLADTLAAADSNATARAAVVSNALDAAKADRAWSRHTSGLGADAPDGFTWISTPALAIAGGLEYERHATSGGEIWVLRANGMAPQFHAAANNAAYLELSDADGTPVWRVEKTDSYLLGVDTTSVSVEGDTLICGVNAVAATHPLARVRASLASGDWAKEEDGIPASLASVTWSGESGAWVCRITNNTGGHSLFATMEYLQEGGVKIVPAAPVDGSAGILCTDGVHRARPVYSNGAVTWEVFQ